MVKSDIESFRIKLARSLELSCAGNGLFLTCPVIAKCYSGAPSFSYRNPCTISSHERRSRMFLLICTRLHALPAFHVLFCSWLDFDTCSRSRHNKYTQIFSLFRRSNAESPATVRYVTRSQKNILKQEVESNLPEAQTEDPARPGMHRYWWA